MTESINELDVVALTVDLPDHKLVRGQVGTVVEILGPDTFEVEFSDDQGRTYAMLPLTSERIMRLYHELADAVH